jgi:hypothetical protein
MCHKISINKYACSGTVRENYGTTNETLSNMIRTVCLKHGKKIYYM